MELTRENAWNLLCKYVEGESLRRHCLAVEASMREYARRFGEDEEYWGFVGLIHDFDFERHPTLDQHPQDGAPILREEGVPEEVVQDVLSHADHTGVPRDSKLRLTLAAVDELSSFVVAVALVRPSKTVDDVKPRSVKKKMKDKAFARAVDRDEMRRNAEALGVDFDEHIQVVVAGLSKAAPELGLTTTEAMAAND
ncbi:MAG: HDIG domain-containing metalloprotein [Chloroflexota bacterium]